MNRYLTMQPSAKVGRPKKGVVNPEPVLAPEPKPKIELFHRFDSMRFDTGYTVSVCTITIGTDGEVVARGKGKHKDKVEAEEIALREARRKYVDGSERLFQKLMLEG